MRQKFNAYLNRNFHDPLVQQLQIPLRRRLIAVTTVLVQLVFAYSFTLIGQDLIWPAAILSLAMILLMGLLNMATRGIFELADEYLDELQIATRDIAYRRAYHFALIWLLLVAPFLGLVEGQPLAKLYTLGFILLGMLWGMVAPRLLVAWTMPADEIEEGV